jgi:hypothetical protein
LSATVAAAIVTRPGRGAALRELAEGSIQ